jgi:hypothetical protein
MTGESKDAACYASAVSGAVGQRDPAFAAGRRLQFEVWPESQAQGCCTLGQRCEDGVEGIMWQAAKAVVRAALQPSTGARKSMRDNS